MCCRVALGAGPAAPGPCPAVRRAYRLGHAVAPGRRRCSPQHRRHDGPARRHGAPRACPRGHRGLADARRTLPDPRRPATPVALGRKDAQSVGDAQPRVPCPLKRLAQRVIFREGETVLAQSSDDAKKRPFSIGASFNTAAQWTSRQCGRASTFAVACVLIVVWAVTGPIFSYSDTWQLVIQHRHHDCHVPDGIPHPEYAEPR